MPEYTFLVNCWEILQEVKKLLHAVIYVIIIPKTGISTQGYSLRSKLFNHQTQDCSRGVAGSTQTICANLDIVVLPLQPPTHKSMPPPCPRITFNRGNSPPGMPPVAAMKGGGTVMEDYRLRQIGQPPLAIICMHGSRGGYHLATRDGFLFLENQVHKYIGEFQEMPFHPWGQPYKWDQAPI